MKIIKKSLKVIAILLLLIIVFGFFYLRSFRPTYEGELALPNLHSEVEVYFDEIGVPHIYAQNDICFLIFRSKQFSRHTVNMKWLHPPQTNRKASNKKLDSQLNYFSRITRDLISKLDENSLLKHKKSRLSLEKSYFLLDRGGVYGSTF